MEDAPRSTTSHRIESGCGEQIDSGFADRKAGERSGSGEGRSAGSALNPRRGISIIMKIGMGQIRVEGGAVGANLGRAEAMIRRAAEAGCDAVVLPECLDLGWTWPEARTSPSPFPVSAAHGSQPPQRSAVSGWWRD